MPDDPRLSIPVFICAIRASRRNAHVARLLLGQVEGRDEVGTTLIALVDLDLGGSVIGPDGLRALASSAHLANLTVLRLGYNGVRDTGAKALAA